MGLSTYAKLLSFASGSTEHMPSLCVDIWIFEQTKALSRTSSENRPQAAAFPPFPEPSREGPGPSGSPQESLQAGPEAALLASGPSPSCVFVHCDLAECLGFPVLRRLAC